MTVSPKAEVTYSGMRYRAYLDGGWWDHRVTTRGVVEYVPSNDQHLVDAHPHVLAQAHREIADPHEPSRTNEDV